MTAVWQQAAEMLFQLLLSPFNQGFWEFILKFIPYVVFFELPIYLLIFIGIVRYVLRRYWRVPLQRPYRPMVSCLITCYAEGRDVERTIHSLTEQLYDGVIEIIAIVDGAAGNTATLEAAMDLAGMVNDRPLRRLTVLPKWQRGGRVSALNTGLNIAKGSVVMALDGDTSFDNTMVASAVRHFVDPHVIGVAGCLRVRNAGRSVVTRLQAIEYMLSIHASKVGLSEFNIVNNISGAFGVFRASFLRAIGGWDSGTAEDLDLTLRMKNYFGRHPHLRIRFEPEAVGHTDAPETLRGFLKQRLRWDGDLFYLYVRKHFLSFAPGILGWRNLIMQLWTGLFFQLVMPFVILAYTLYVVVFYPPAWGLAVWALVYLFYLAVSLVFFVMYIVFLSERPVPDLKLAVWLPLVPLFTFITRIWCGVATLNEWILRSHLDSTMAPWWVLRKSKY